ncbi:hypothetical protein AVEN_39357-1 [Araneus ventricosus]|uniref:Uncharacterized protein n=1 Tax=Araneus ventricosus TaxID=182803 RepID=A0A4Y2N1D2_ARAVE|nr:hypothetical protein AVEN_39357-1 [Araneus ventricosus]
MKRGSRCNFPAHSFGVIHEDFIEESSSPKTCAYSLPPFKTRPARHSFPSPRDLDFSLAFAFRESSLPLQGHISFMLQPLDGTNNENPTFRCLRRDSRRNLILTAGFGQLHSSRGRSLVNVSANSISL